MPIEISDPYLKYESLLSYKMHDTALKYLTSKSNTRAIIKGNQGGGCLEENTNIQLYSGIIKKIKDINPFDYVLSLDEDYKIVASLVLKKIDSGIKPTVTIKTRTGRDVTTTTCHPFY